MPELSGWLLYYRGRGKGLDGHGAQDAVAHFGQRADEYLRWDERRLSGCCTVETWRAGIGQERWEWRAVCSRVKCKALEARGSKREFGKGEGQSTDKAPSFIFSPGNMY